MFCFPTWCFGLPAMLKGYFDRLFMPGVAFDISDPANVKPMLTHIQRISRRRHLRPAALGGLVHGRPAAQDRHALHEAPDRQAARASTTTPTTT